MSGAIPESEWLSVGVITQEIEKLIEPFNATQIPVRVIDTAVEALPQSDDSGVVSGFVFDERIHIVREGVADTGVVARTLWHEMLHFGLRRFMNREQYISGMDKLYQTDDWVKNKTNAWVAGPEGKELYEQGHSGDYIRARGVDEALAELAEILQTEPTGYRNNALITQAKRSVCNWAAKLADQFGNPEAAKAWRDYAAQKDARDLVVSVFSRLREGVPPPILTTRWHYSDTAFKRVLSQTAPSLQHSSVPDSPNKSPESPKKRISSRSTTKREETQKRDFRQDLTDQIVGLVESGAAPWQKPWQANDAAAFFRLPINGATGRAYRGGNRFLLMAKAEAYGSEDNRWCTFKQAEAKGWKIKKGSKGTQVEYWQFDKEEKKLNPITGKEEEVRVKLDPPRVFYATVFHATQIDGIPELAPIQKPDGWSPIAEAERLLSASGAKIFNDQVDNAYYDRQRDEIHLPPMVSFPSALNYYEVALHELAHWSGHPSRLNREHGGFGSPDYAREELRAQMASLYLSAELGVPFSPERHATYQASWIQALESDKNEIFKAARDAEEITKHILGLVIQAPQQEKQAETQPETPTLKTRALEPIRRITFESAERNTVQETIASRVEANPEPFIDHFKTLHQSLDGRFISADTFKETFEQYRESNEARNIFNTPLHNSAAVLASEQLRRVLQEAPEAGRNYVVLLTGIPGAGKTSSVLESGALPPKVHAVYEGQLADPKIAIAKVQEVIDAGFKPVIVVAHTKPEQALDNTLQRFNEVGRGASINVMAKIQAGLPEGLAAVRDKFGDAVELRITDRRDFLNPTRLKGWEQLSTLTSEGNHEHIKQRLEQHLENRRSELSPESYRQAAGLAPVTRANSGRDHGHANQQYETFIDGRSAAPKNRQDARVSSSSQYAAPTVRESDKVSAALAHLAPDDRELWVKMAMAVKNGLGEDGFALWDNWGQGAESYRSADALDVWRSVKTGRGIDLGTLYFEAKKHGFKPGEWRTQEAPLRQDNSAQREAQRAADAAKTEAKYQAAAKKAWKVFEQANPIDSQHTYLRKKGIADLNVLRADINPAALRVLSANELKAALGYLPKADGEPLSGNVLICPVTNGKSLSTLEFIDEHGRKSALAGGKKSGAWYAPVTKQPKDLNLPTVIVEGIATAVSVHAGLNPSGQAPKAYVVAALSDTNLKNVVQALKALRPHAPIIIGADSNSIQKARDAAAEVNGQVMFPTFEPNAQVYGKAPTDFNDLMILRQNNEHFVAEMTAIFCGVQQQTIVEPVVEPTTPVITPAVAVPVVPTPTASPPPSTQGDLKMETSKETVSQETPTETPKKFASKAIGAPIYKVDDLPPEVTAFIKDRFGSRTMIATPKENGSYKGEVLDTQTHLIQSVSARSVVVHRKDEMTFKGSVEQANKSDKLSGWELGIYYDGNKPAVYPHDSQRESFEFAAKQLRKQTPDAEKPAFDERAKAAWSNVVQMRKQRAAMQKAASTPEKAPEKAPETSKPEVKETKPSKQKR